MEACVDGARLRCASAEAGITVGGASQRWKRCEGLVRGDRRAAAARPFRGRPPLESARLRKILRITFYPRPAELLPKCSMETLTDAGGTSPVTHASAAR